MKKTIIYTSVLLILSCSAPKIHIPGNYEYDPVFEGPKEMNATLSNIETAGELAEKYPEEEIINKEIEVSMTFEYNDEYDSTLFAKPKEKKKKSKDSELEKLSDALKSINNGKDITYSISQTESDEESTERPLPDGEVFAYTRYKNTFVSIKDFITENYYIYYDDVTPVKNVKIKIDDNVAEMNGYNQKGSGGYFKSDGRYKIYSFNLPIRGTEVEIKYLKDSRDAKFNSVIYIPEDHFTKKKIVKIAMPDWLEFDVIEKNMDSTSFKKEIIEESAKSDDEDESVDKKGNKIKKKKKSGKKQKFLVYTFKDVPAFPSLRSARGASYNIPMLYIHYKTANGTEGKKNLMRNTDDLYKWYRLVSGSLKNDTASFAKFTKELVKNAKTDEEKIKTVYYWIQDNIRYIAFEDGIAGFKPDECKDVFANRYGDCKGMANLAKNMLKILGYDARMTWIGTRHLNFSYDKPGLPVDNHAICAVKLNGKFIFLDATENYCPINNYANRIQGRQCIVEDGNSYTVERIPSFGPDYNDISTNETADLVDGNLNIKGKKTFKGESKIVFLRSYNFLKTQNKERAMYFYLTDEKQYIEASNISTSDLSNRDIDAFVNYNLTVGNHSFVNNGKTYVNLDWDRDYANFEFDSTYKVDYDLDFKRQVNKTLTLNLKPGQKASKIPTAISIDNDYYTFNLEIKQVGNTLVYKKKMLFKQDYLPLNVLNKFNEHSKQLNQFYNSYVEIN